jgi:hypothetical protein
VSHAITRVQHDTSGTAAGIQRQHSLYSKAAAAAAAAAAARRSLNLGTVLCHAGISANMRWCR